MCCEGQQAGAVASVVWDESRQAIAMDIWQGGLVDIGNEGTPSPNIVSTFILQRQKSCSTCIAERVITSKRYI